MCFAASGTLAADGKVSLPLVRTAYQTNESFPVSVARSDAGGLKAGQLVATLSGNDGSKLTFTFDVPGGANARSEILNFNAALLRPGHYTLDIAVDGGA